MSEQNTQVEYLRLDGKTVRGLVVALASMDCPYPTPWPGQVSVGKCRGMGLCECYAGRALDKAYGEE